MSHIDTVRFIPLDLMRPSSMHRNFGRRVTFAPQTGFDGSNLELLAQPRSGDVTRKGIQYFILPAEMIDENGAAYGGAIGIIEPESIERETREYGMTNTMHVTEVLLYCTNNGEKHNDTGRGKLVSYADTDHRSKLQEGSLLAKRRSGLLNPHCITPPDDADRISGMRPGELFVAHTFHHEGNQLIFTKFSTAQRTPVRT